MPAAMHAAMHAANCQPATATQKSAAQALGVPIIFKTGVFKTRTAKSAPAGQTSRPPGESGCDRLHVRGQFRPARCQQ